MASGKKQVQQLARQFFKLSVVDGELSSDRVAGVLQYIEKHRPPHALAILKTYQRLIAAEVARRQAVIEHAGPLDDSVLANIATSMSRKYKRRISSLPRRNEALLAGLRIRVGDDVYESSVAGQLAALAGAV
ncbi:MAG: F0F1 ATP synthase subunit delta [Opitutaceae bacterium]